MAKNDRYSRLNPGYLSRRHAGTVFLFLALGLFAGVLWRSLLQPVRFSAAAAARVAVVPPELADGFDWGAKSAEWAGLLRNPRDRALLGSNLRHALKLAVTLDEELPVGGLSGILDDFGDGESFSASLFLSPFLARLGPAVEVTRGEIAANLDLQSLAAIVADLDPGPGVEGWDFGFFDIFLPLTQEDAVIVSEDARDPYLRVLFTLHRLLTGSNADSLDAALRTAADELSSRLDREARFAGGGGFGPDAKRELMREIAAIPVLAANGLYRAAAWRGGDGDPLPPGMGWSARWADCAEVGLTPGTSGSGDARAAFSVELRPLGYPRDTVFTRMPPLAASTILATLAARERREPFRAEAEAPAAAPAVPEPNVPESAPARPEPAATYREEVDAAADGERLARIASAEESHRAAGRGLDACLRRLNAAREDESRMSVEAMNARRRADRLRERYDAAAVLAEAGGAPGIPEELRELVARRDEINRRLNALLAYCTEEHPFVKAARRDLAAAEAVLGGRAPGSDAVRAAEAVAARAASAHVEWEAASSAADGLEERRRRQAEAVAGLAGEAEKMEREAARLGAELAAAKRVPVPTRRVKVAEASAPRPRPAAPVPAPAVSAPPPPAVPAAPDPRLVFSVPGDVPLRAEARGWGAVWRCVLCGLFLGLAASAVRELLSSRFASPGEARRMVKLPVLASLPAYDAKSFRLSAGAAKGGVKGRKAGFIQFIPTPVELFEPPAEGRRGRVAPRRRRPRVLAWGCGLALVLAAAILHYRSAGGIAQPGAAFRDGLPSPALAVPAWTEARGGQREWGDMP